MLFLFLNTPFNKNWSFLDDYLELEDHSDDYLELISHTNVCLSFEKLQDDIAKINLVNLVKIKKLKILGSIFVKSNFKHFKILY